jgi:hypothetical protein
MLGRRAGFLPRPHAPWLVFAIGRPLTDSEDDEFRRAQYRNADSTTSRPSSRCA